MGFSSIATEKEWQEVLSNLPDFYGKVYYQYAYFGALKANKEGVPMAHVYRGKKGLAFYPFLLRKTPNELYTNVATLYDIESPYGYGGPHFHNLTSQEEQEFFKNHEKWANNHNIIAEFVRYSPFVTPSHATQNYYNLVHNRTTVQLSLSNEFDEILNQCTNPRKRNYKRATKYLYSKIMPLTHETMNSFQTMYNHHMKRLKASNYYFFSKDYFTALAAMPTESVQLIFVHLKSNNQLTGAGIFLLDKSSIHYHLGATDPQYQHLQPSTMLLLSGAKYGAETKRQLLHLGGGLEDNPNDPLFTFKKGFSKEHLSFKIGKKIHNPSIYSQLSNTWQKITGNKSPQLLHYHNLGDQP
jgi:hypothetical protein